MKNQQTMSDKFSKWFWQHAPYQRWCIIIMIGFALFDILLLIGILLLEWIAQQYQL